MLDLFVYLQCGCLTSSCCKEPWSRSCKSGSRDQGKSDYLAHLLHQAIMHILLIPPLPLHLLLIIIIIIFLLLLLFPLLQEGPIEQALACLHTGLASSSPQVPKKWQIWNYSQVTKLWQVLKDYFFRGLSSWQNLKNWYKNWKRTKEPSIVQKIN